LYEAINHLDQMLYQDFVRLGLARSINNVTELLPFASEMRIFSDLAMLQQRKTRDCDAQKSGTQKPNVKCGKYTWFLTETIATKSAQVYRFKPRVE